MTYKIKYVKFLSDGSSYFCFNTNSANYINKIDFKNKKDINIISKNKPEFNKYLYFFKNINKK